MQLPELRSDFPTVVKWPSHNWPQCFPALQKPYNPFLSLLEAFGKQWSTALRGRLRKVCCSTKRWVGHANFMMGHQILFYRTHESTVAKGMQQIKKKKKHHKLRYMARSPCSRSCYSGDTPLEDCFPPEICQTSFTFLFILQQRSFKPNAFRWCIGWDDSNKKLN